MSAASLNSPTRSTASGFAASPNTAPTEFRYHERLNHPVMQALRAGCRTVLGVDPAPSAKRAEDFGAMYYDADPLAEAFVDEVYLGRSPEEGRRLLEAALSQGVDNIPDAPQSLRDLFADLETAPDWVDPDEVERGARVFRRWGTDVFRFAGAITLCAYTENSVAKPLALTGAYASSSTKSRFLETASFWIDVSEPGGLHPGAPGRAVALRVRIMHVFVRRRLLQHPEWNTEAWGVPISQADALLTLLGGSAAPGLALQFLGYRTSAEEVRATMHFWRYVGHLMGVRPRFYPENFRDVADIAFMTMLKGAHGAGEDGKHLCRSFMQAFEAPEEPTPKQRFEDLEHRGFVRLFVPPGLYAKLGLPSAGLSPLIPLAQVAPRFVLETLRRRSRALDNLADKRQRAKRQRWLETHREREAAFEAVREFTR